MRAGRQTVERRQLGLTLKRLRERAGKTQQDAARALKRDAARISQVETAKGSFSVEELTVLLDFYNADAAERQLVLDLGRQARTRQRGRAYIDQLPRAFERLADLQADAKQIGFYETGIVPGLAQTREYVTALMHAGDGYWWPRSSAEVDRRVEFRLEQQRRVLDSDDTKQVAFVLTETALHQVVGGRSVLRGQILHLLQLNERSDVAVQVIRSDVPDNPLLGGGLITLDFGASAPRIAFTTSHGTSTYHDQEADVFPMFRAFDRVRDSALPPEETSDLLLAKLKDMT